MYQAFSKQIQMKQNVLEAGKGGVKSKLFPAGDLDQLAERLPSLYEPLSLIPKHHINQVWWCKTDPNGLEGRRSRRIRS